MDVLALFRDPFEYWSVIGFFVGHVWPSGGVTALDGENLIQLGAVTSATCDRR